MDVMLIIMYNICMRKTRVHVQETAVPTSELLKEISDIAERNLKGTNYEVLRELHDLLLSGTHVDKASAKLIRHHMKQASGLQLKIAEVEADERIDGYNTEK